MARLLEKFNPSNPITSEEIICIEDYLNEQLEPLFEAIKEHHPEDLVGASGAFETFFALCLNGIPEGYPLNGNHAREISIGDYSEIHEILLCSTMDERMNMKGMEPVRVDMIVLATIFVNFTIQKCGIRTIIQSDYALKEGVVAEILNI